MASSTGARPEPEALPGLVELRGERPVHVEVAGLDRQVVGFERAAALLVDDVEGADQPDVVHEVRVVARPPAAVDVADEGRAADGTEDEVGATEDEVPLRVAGMQTEGRGREATRASVWAGSRRTRRFLRSTVAPAAANASSTRSPRTSTPISDRIRSEAWWIASTWSADRISSGRNGLTRSARAVAGARARRGAAGADGTSAHLRATARWAVDGVHDPMLRRAPGRGRARRGRCVVTALQHALRRVSDARTVMAADARRALRACMSPGEDWKRTTMRLKILAIVALAVVGLGAAFVAIGGLPANAASTPDYLTSAATTGNVTDDVAATGPLATTVSYGLSFGSAPHLAGATQQQRGRVNDLDRLEARRRRSATPSRRAPSSRSPARPTSSASSPTRPRPGNRPGSIRTIARQTPRGRVRHGRDPPGDDRPQQRRDPVVRRPQEAQDLAAQIERATLTAPIDGVVTAVNSQRARRPIG